MQRQPACFVRPLHLAGPTCSFLRRLRCCLLFFLLCWWLWWWLCWWLLCLHLFCLRTPRLRLQALLDQLFQLCCLCRLSGLFCRLCFFLRRQLLLAALPGIDSLHAFFPHHQSQTYQLGRPIFHLTRLEVNDGLRLFRVADGLWRRQLMHQRSHSVMTIIRHGHVQQRASLLVLQVSLGFVDYQSLERARATPPRCFLKRISAL
mmetsp:Transcript_99110/g.176571  ORF Transcript_99110/g.176571 Transcript_99110/m.176571 type:complete len:204 (-) Transcript_99110:2306-2917(-)